MKKQPSNSVFVRCFGIDIAVDGPYGFHSASPIVKDFALPEISVLSALCTARALEPLGLAYASSFFNVSPYLAKSVEFASHDRVVGVTQTSSEVVLVQIKEALS